MNYLWSHPGYYCDLLYPGAMFFNYFNKFDDFLFIVTLFSIFAYMFFKKYKNKKLFTKLIFSLLYSCGVDFIRFFFMMLLNLTTSVGNYENYSGGRVPDCWSQGYYLIFFLVSYLLFSLFMYIDLRIIYGFIDKQKKYMTWINIIFIVIVGILLIGLMFSEGKLDMLNR